MAKLIPLILLLTLTSCSKIKKQRNTESIKALENFRSACINFEPSGAMLVFSPELRSAYKNLKELNIETSELHQSIDYVLLKMKLFQIKNYQTSHNIINQHFQKDEQELLENQFIFDFLNSFEQGKSHFENTHLIYGFVNPSVILQKYQFIDHPDSLSKVLLDSINHYTKTKK